MEGVKGVKGLDRALAEIQRAIESYTTTVAFFQADTSRLDCHWIGIHPTPHGARAVLYNVDQPLRSWLFSSVDYAVMIARRAVGCYEIDENAQRILVLRDGVWHRERQHA